MKKLWKFKSKDNQGENIGEKALKVQKLWWEGYLTQSFMCLGWKALLKIQKKFVKKLSALCFHLKALKKPLKKLYSVISLMLLLKLEKFYPWKNYRFMFDIYKGVIVSEHHFFFKTCSTLKNFLLGWGQSQQISISQGKMANLFVTDSVTKISTRNNNS